MQINVCKKSFMIVECVSRKKSIMILNCVSNTPDIPSNNAFIIMLLRKMALLMGFFWESSSGENILSSSINFWKNNWSLNSCLRNSVTNIYVMQGLSNRRTGSTSINAESSRSHTVFTCVVESQYTVITDSRTHVLNNCPMHVHHDLLIFTIEIYVYSICFLTLVCRVIKVNHHFCRMWQMVQAALKPVE